MPSHDPLTMSVILTAAFVAAIVKGVTTMGLGLIAVPAIALFLDVQTAVLSLFISKFVSDVAMLVESKRDLAWRSSLRLRSFVVAGAIAIPVATYLLATLQGKWLHIFLGASILAFVAYQLSPRPIVIPVRHEGPWGAGFGMAAGATQALTGVGGPYTAMYLYALRLKPSQFVFLSSVVYLLFDVMQLTSILYLGLYDRTRLFYAIATLAPVLVGTWLGIRARARMNPRAFKLGLLMLLAASAVSVLVRGVTM
jgi:uncharacterized membrane protein YfcA